VNADALPFRGTVNARARKAIENAVTACTAARFGRW
jgi:hypothetical protein